jgi:hypothetical protein
MLRRLALAGLIALFPAVASAQMATIAPTAAPGYNSDRIANTAFVQSTAAGISALTGDVTATGPGSATATLATVNSNTGPFGSATQCVTVTNNAKGLTTAVSATTCTPAIGSVSGLGVGVGAALALAPNTSGGFATSASPVFIGTISGTYTLGGTPTINGGTFTGSPLFTGTPSTPTAAPGTNTTQLANTAFVQAAVTGSVAGVASVGQATGALDVPSVSHASAYTALQSDCENPILLGGNAQFTLTVNAPSTYGCDRFKISNVDIYTGSGSGRASLLLRTQSGHQAVSG